jgi:cell wall assembly regulator SMI1
LAVDSINCRSVPENRNLPLLNMHLYQIRRRFDSLASKGLVYRLAPGATLEEIRTAETLLGLEFPEQVVSFWDVAFGNEPRNGTADVQPW